MQRIMDNITETTAYGEDIISLWQQAFGDSREDVLFFLNNCRNKSCVCLYDGVLCSMLFLVDCNISGTEYKYIYAACTDKSSREKGCMTKLLEYCRSNYSHLVLIPADERLVDYYGKRNFNHKINIQNILFNECKEIKDYLLEGCSLAEPFALACEVE